MRKFVISGLVVAVVIAYWLFSSATPPQSQEKQRESDAYLACRQHLSTQLKAPSTASFAAFVDDRTTVTHADSRYTVRSSVDAENGFGAQLRTTYTCVAEIDVTGAWHVVTLDIDK